MPRQDYLITYDVETTTPAGARRLKKVAKLCENHGQRVQFSVFICSLDRSQLEVFEAKAVTLIDPKKDSFHVYSLIGGRDRCLRAHGIDRYQSYDGPLVL